MPCYRFRPALLSDAEELTRLAFTSKAYWGYPAEWLELWRDELTVTSTMIEQGITYVAEYYDEIVGFWYVAAAMTEQTVPVMVFIHPKHIRKGLAKQLWN